MLTMQISLLIPILLQAVASTLAADISTTGSHNSYSCTAVSDELSEYCCVQFQLYPGDLDHCPDVQVYNYAGEIIASSQLSYGIAEALYSNLCYTVDVTANFTYSLDGTEWVDNNNFWYAGTKYGAYNTSAADLAVLAKTTTTSTKEAALTAAYWFKCGSACDRQQRVSTTCSAAASVRARARSF